MINKSVAWPLAAVLSVCLLACARTVPAQAAEPQTVMDYYLLLPKEDVPTSESTKKSRKELIKKQDVANGFLEVSDDNLQGITQIALFRKKDREALIGVAQTEQTIASQGGVKFLLYRAGKWIDVTDQVLPTVPDKEILAAYNRIKKGDDEARSLKEMPSTYYELPKKGTTVELRCGEDSDSKEKTLFRFAWDGVRFTRQGK